MVYSGNQVGLSLAAGHWPVCFGIWLGICECELGITCYEHGMLWVG